MNKLLVSPSPHTHGKQSTNSIMTDVLIALLPAVLVSIFANGWSVVVLVLVGIASCILFEYLIQKYLLKRDSHDWCGSAAAVTGVLLALNLPPSAPWWLIVIGSLVAIGIAKMTFGGLGQNIFNPALVGRVFLLVSFPVLMTSWNASGSWFAVDAFSGATPLGAVKEALANGQTLSQITADDLTFSQEFFFNVGGSAGELSSIALILGFFYLWIRKVIKPTIPVTILLTVFVFSGIFWLANPEQFTNPLFNIFSGGLLLGAIFMATDYVTSPMTTKGQIIFSIGIGVITVLIRYFGSYPEGVSFAILIMNCCVPLLNKYCKPKRFGEAK